VVTAYFPKKLRSGPRIPDCPLDHSVLKVTMRHSMHLGGVVIGKERLGSAPAPAYAFSLKCKLNRDIHAKRQFAWGDRTGRRRRSRRSPR
jgi:hypothetical protein